MSIRNIDNSDQVRNLMNKGQEKMAEQAAAKHPDKFRNILAQTYNAVTPSEKAEKERFNKDKEDREGGEGMEEEEETIQQNVQKIKKSLKTLIEQERQTLDL
jgi:hypothetical protein